MILKEILNKTKEHFHKAGFDNYKFEADQAISHALNCNRLDLYLKLEIPLNNHEVEKCREVVRRRAKGEPLAYITEKAFFYETSFFIEEGVLIPRFDSEVLIEKSLSIYKNKEPKTILDLACGSGCLGLTLALKWKNSHLIAVDNSNICERVFTKNLENLSLQNRGCFKRLDLDKEESYSQINFEDVDFIICNPPYIAMGDKDVEKAVMDYEPKEALFAGQTGLEKYINWLDFLAKKLKPDTLLVFEIGWKQKDGVKKIIDESANYEFIEGLKDMNENDRGVVFKYYG